MDKKELLQQVFGAKPLPPPADAVIKPPIEQPKPYRTRESVSRESISPEITAQAQAMVWGNGNPPPPKPPPAPMIDRGQAPAMSNQTGWGKL